MAYTPTTWVTGDTVTATKMNKLEQGVANAGGGYDFVITGEWDDGEFYYDNFILDSGTYSDLVTKIQNGTTINGLLLGSYDNFTYLNTLAYYCYSQEDSMIFVGFDGTTPGAGSYNSVALIINSDGTVDPD